MIPSDYVDEPLLVPRLTAISQLDWYCLDLTCCTMRRSEGEIRSHYSAAHGVLLNDLQNEVHYARGTRLLMMQIYRHTWECDQEQRLSLHLQSLTGADDFVTEIDLAKERERSWGDGRNEDPPE